MKVIKPLMLNKFRPVSIPRTKDLFDRIGRRPSHEISGGVTSELGKNKLQQLNDSYNEIMEEFKQSTQTQ